MVSVCYGSRFRYYHRFTVITANLRYYVGFTVIWVIFIVITVITLITLNTIKSYLTRILDGFLSKSLELPFTRCNYRQFVTITIELP